ncbi:MAG: thiolase family protein [Proteobacteria bacterium]|nr:thiolase family protein [Pseudomonadota bacterium]
MTVTKYRRSLPKGNGKPVIIDGVRTAFVKSFGVFEDSDALELYSRVIDGLIRRLELDPEELDEVSCGVVVPQTKNGNVARDAVLNLGLPAHIHGLTLNRACTSSLQTISDAARNISFGNPALILAGGVECLSDVPIVYSREARKFLVTLNKARTTASKLNLLKNFSAKAWLPKPPSLSEPLTGFTMGEHAEMMAKINRISKHDQDLFAVESHKKAAAAVESGYFDAEIIPTWPTPKYAVCVDRDNMVRADTSIEALKDLKPAFDRRYGTITAGNASPLTDGAAVTLIADEARAKSLGLKAKARIKDMVFVGVNPYEQLLIGPAIAIPLLLKKNGLTLNDIDLFEIHEAFAAQVLSCTRSMESTDFMERHFGTKALGAFPMDRVNVNGGALAIGHPFGATGSRLVTTLSNELIRSDKNLGLIAICAAGGMSGAMLIERI